MAPGFNTGLRANIMVGYRIFLKKVAKEFAIIRIMKWRNFHENYRRFFLNDEHENRIGDNIIKKR